MEFKSVSTLCVAVAVLLISHRCTCYELTIVHNNDVHAHFEQVNKYSGECSEEQAKDEKCYGGEPRRVTFIKDARSRYKNTLVLDAGDRYTGTLWFNQYHGMAAATFVNKENYDAMCLGNHEFDLGVEGLVPFLDNLTVPVLDANIDVSREKRLQGKFNKTLVKTVGGVKVGIIGITTKETSFISKPGPTVTFEDEVTTVRAQTKLLKASGVPIIIVLSHSGYGIDKKIAREVDGVDVIVGGHSHTFLYTGEPLPSIEEPEGPYPTVIEQEPSGRKVLVVQAYAWGKYMGFLNVTFDENYDVKSWSGDPVLLDKTIARDPETLAIVEKMKIPLTRKRQEVVGKTLVQLEGDPIQCRLRECNSGNLLTDSMVYYGRGPGLLDGQWTVASISVMSGGGIRASTEQGNITMGQVLTVLPFGNTIELIRLYGVHLREAFEHSVAHYDPHDRPGAFFQVSGIHVTYDLNATSGSRVVSLEALCLNCSVPVYEPVDDSLVYNLFMLDFTIDGGDGFDVIKNNLVDRKNYGWLDIDVLTSYIRKNSPIYADIEGRIKFVEAPPSPTTQSPQQTSQTPNPCDRTTGAAPPRHTSSIASLIAALVLVFSL